MNRWLGLVVAMSAGCAAAAADHERLGDQAYREGRFAKSVVEYQAAQRSGARSRVWAKAAAAAVRAEDFSAAASAYTELAREDQSRVLEAVVGLDRLARAAGRAGASGQAAVTKAVLAIRALAPGRPLGRLARASLFDGMELSDALGLIPAALAVTGTARGIDSLLLRYADARRATIACDDAAAGYRTLLRRTNDGRQRGLARGGLADCALLLGQDALSVRNGRAAERWFDLVVGFETETPRAIRAQIGLGDARVLLGDALGAAVAYQAVLAASGVSDSLRVVAVTKLNGLGAASTEPPADGGA